MLDCRSEVFVAVFRRIDSLVLRIEVAFLIDTDSSLAQVGLGVGSPQLIVNPY